MLKYIRMLQSADLRRPAPPTETKFMLTMSSSETSIKPPVKWFVDFRLLLELTRLYTALALARICVSD